METQPSHIHRLTVNYKPINKITKFNAFSVPHIENLLEKFINIFQILISKTVVISSNYILVINSKLLFVHLTISIYFLSIRT